jgi:hypothetical protein
MPHPISLVMWVSITSEYLRILPALEWSVNKVSGKEKKKDYCILFQTLLGLT